MHTICTDCTPTCSSSRSVSPVVMAEDKNKKEEEKAAVDSRVSLVESRISSHPDFPRRGVVFKDIFGIFADYESFTALMSLLRDEGRRLRGRVDAVVGLDARGFLLAPAVAEAAAVPFLPVRKRGKLPGEVCSASFALEYGQAEVEVQRAPLVDLLGGKEESAVLRVAAVDDLLATGGTMEAAVNVVKSACSGRARLVECFFLIELDYLRGRDKLMMAEEKEGGGAGVESVSAMVHVKEE